MNKYNYLIIGSALYGPTFHHSCHRVERIHVGVLQCAGGEKTPVARRLAASVLTLPLYADLSMEDVDRICKIIRR